MDDRPHIVVVEDEAAQRHLLVDYLAKQNFRVSGVDGGAALRQLIERELPQLVLLDVGLPGEDGFTLARWLREKSSRIGIIMVTVAADTVDRVVGLETGADDYIPKPFEPRELLLRIQNILKRRQGPSGPRDEVSMGDFVFHVGRGELKRGEESIKLTERERDLLRHFAQRPGTPVARHELAADDSTGTERAVDVQINRLRRKIESDPAHPVYLQTVRGKGYILYTD
jgi:two-component system phosphate regulon response regulator OmpR